MTAIVTPKARYNYVTGSMSRWVGIKQGVLHVVWLSVFLCTLVINELLKAR